MNRLQLTTAEYDSYYQRYLNKLSEEKTLVSHFYIDKTETAEFFLAIPENKLEYRYAPNKWNIKEIFQHIIDTERIFMHRCFRIARRDITPIAGFDQDIYINPAGANNKTLRELLIEFVNTRNYSLNILESLTEENLKFIGNANNSAMSARAAAFVIPGHNIWHKEIILERYL